VVEAFHAAAAGGPADHAVVHHNHTFAGHDVAYGIQLDLHADVALALAGRDERAADVVVAYKTLLKGQAHVFGVALGGAVAAVGHGHDDVGVHVAFDGEL